MVKETENLNEGGARGVAAQGKVQRARRNISVYGNFLLCLQMNMLMLGPSTFLEDEDEM